MLKQVEGLRGFLLNISKTIQLIFTKPVSLFRKLSTVSFEIKRLKTGHSLLLCYGNQFMRERWAKNHDQREKKWHFS